MKQYFKTFIIVLIVWILSVYTYFLGNMFYNGLVNINDYSMPGIITFITGICTIIIIFTYPIRMLLEEEIKNKKDKKKQEKQKQKKQNNNNQEKTTE